MSDRELDEFLAEADPHGLESPPAEQVDDETDANSYPKKRKAPEKVEVVKKPKIQENRAIYVTNLPLDTTMVELETAFKKYGIIDQGTDSKPRIKMYSDDDGEFNGEALIVYFRKESIALAIKMLDDYWFRLEDQTSGKITVKEADFSYKREKNTVDIAAKLTRKDRKAAEANRANLNKKLSEWSDDEGAGETVAAPIKNKWAKTVIIKKAFSLEELEKHVELILEIKEDFREEGDKHGNVTSVTLFDLEEEGIVTVKFRKVEEAEAFCLAVDGKGYAKRKLEVTIAQDRPKFKRGQRSPSPGEEDSE